MITWLNENDGFVMAILTFVYVVATIFIFISNKKSATAAINANKQQYALALLNQRLSAYYCLNNLVSVAKTLSITNFPFGTPLDAFNSMLYNNAKDNYLNELNIQLNKIEVQLRNSDLPKEDFNQLIAKQAQLTQMRFMRRLTSLNEEFNQIKELEILFPDIDFLLIKKFLDSFSLVVIDSKGENIESLKAITGMLDEKNILNSIWFIMKDMGK